LSIVTADTLTWPDCVVIASANNKTLLIAREQVTAQTAAVSVAQGNFWPQISVGANTQHAESTVQNPTVTTKTDSVGYSAGVKQDVFDGFQTAEQVAAAQQTLEAVRYNYAVTETNVRQALRSAFVDLLKAQEQRSITELIATRRAQNMAMIKLRYDGGLEHRGSLLLAQADLAQAQADVASAARAITLSQRNIATILGKTMDPFVVTENVEELQITTPDFETIAETSDTLRELAAKLDAAKHSAAAVHAVQLPQIYANYQTGKSGNSWPPDDAQWSLGGNLSFTVFDGNTNGANAAKADSAVRQANLQVLDGHQTVIFTLAQTWSALADTRDALTVAESFLVAAEERSKIADAQYASGLLTFDNWSIIEDNLVSAQKSLVAAKAAVLQAEANWVQACGGGLDAK
jgi:outer membrane protein TolC